MEVTILVSEGVHLELSCVRVPPNLNMSVFPMPTKVVKKSEKLRRDFLWKGTKQGKEYYLVNWKNAQLSREHDGLRIRNVKLQNTNLLTY